MLASSFNKFYSDSLIVESSEGVLQHLSHIEELILTNKQQGLELSIEFLRGLLDTFKGKIDSSVFTTIKFDGAPSIIAGINPENNEFFVATKSITNVNSKINYNDLDIDKNHGHAPGLVNKLKLALRYLPAVIKNGVYQGDFMFSKEDLKTTTIENEDYIVFKPNTITYAIERHSPLGQRILNAKIGVVFHTKLTGQTIQTLKASPQVNLMDFNQSQDVFLDDAKFKDMSGNVTFTADETQNAERLINNIINAGKKVKWEQIPDNLYSHLKTFVNFLVRQGEFVGKPTDSYEQFVNWITSKAASDSQNLKTERGKQKRQEIFQQYLGNVKANESNLLNLFNLTKKIDQIKKMFVTKYNTAVKTKQFITQPDGSLKVTAPEGYVAVDHLGNMVKLVDRLEFSKANFAVSKQEKFT